MPWPLPPQDADLLDLAKSYPFEAPAGSYLFAEGMARPLSPGENRAELYAGRVPVIAHGSNRAPAQLRRKFGDQAEIPVTRGWLRDYDAVYSAHMTQYGSIAANLQYTPGVRVAVFVTWLSAPQLERMHATELGGENYVYGAMERIEMVLETDPAATLAQAYIYLSVRGCLAVGAAPIALAAVEAHGRAHGALHQHEVLALVCGRHGAGAALDGFILAHVRDQALRRALIAGMGAGAIPMAAPHFRSMLP